VKESVIAKSPRAALQRQAAIAAVARAHQVLVNAPPQAPIIERDLQVVWANWFRPALAKRCKARQKAQLSEQV
jgi:hypothetical protein